MVLRMYSVYDKKSQVYHPGQYCHNDPHALRFFSMQFENKDSVMGKYPEDFDIYRVGEFDDSTGLVKSCTPEYIINVYALLNASNGRKMENGKEQ